MKFLRRVGLAVGKVRNTVLGSYPSLRNCMKGNKSKYGISKKLLLAKTAGLSYEGSRSGSSEKSDRLRENIFCFEFCEGSLTLQELVVRGNPSSTI